MNLIQVDEGLWRIVCKEPAPTSLPPPPPPPLVAWIQVPSLPLPSDRLVRRMYVARFIDDPDPLLQVVLRRPLPTLKLPANRPPDISPQEEVTTVLFFQGEEISTDEATKQGVKAYTLDCTVGQLIPLGGGTDQRLPSREVQVQAATGGSTLGGSTVSSSSASQITPALIQVNEKLWEIVCEEEPAPLGPLPPPPPILIWIILPIMRPENCRESIFEAHYTLSDPQFHGLEPNPPFLHLRTRRPDAFRDKQVLVQVYFADEPEPDLTVARDAGIDVYRLVECTDNEDILIPLTPSTRQ